MTFRFLLVTSILCFHLHFSSAQEIPIVLLEEGHILTQVQINDSVSANFLLDTGAGAIVISSVLFDKIESSIRPAGHFTGFRHDGDRLDGELFQIPSIALGGYEVNDLKAGVYPPLDDYGIDGLLSLKFFEHKPFTIDYRKSLINLLSEEEMTRIKRSQDARSISLIRHGDVSLDLMLPICVGESLEVDALFDTGSGHSLHLLNPFFAMQLGLDTASLEKSSYQAPLSGRSLVDYRFSTAVGLCESTREDQVVLMREGLIYEALVGSGFFKNGSITIDLLNEKIFFQR